METIVKHLFIIRHAKSDWSFDVSDFERPLNARGFKNAPMMADRLSNYEIQPRYLISSPAKRAFTTAQIFAERLGISLRNIHTDPRIYEAQPQTLLSIVNELDNTYEAVALFGHNPGLTLLVNYLTDDYTYELPTCGIVHLRFDDVSNWAMISGGMGVGAWFTTPNNDE